MAVNTQKSTSGKGKAKTIFVPEIAGRLQPQAKELEEAVLGALMLEKDAYYQVSEILKPECFYDKSHELIYQAVVSLAMNQRPVDMLTVTEQLRKQGDLDTVGGPFYISQLTSKVASSSHIEYHARIIAQKFLARELITFSGQIQGKAFDETIDVEDLMQEAEGRLFEISQRNIKNEATQIDRIIVSAKDLMKKAAQQTEGLSGIHSGFHSLDKMTFGWQNSDLIIIAARPSMGKTAFALSMVKNMAVHYNTPVAFFSLEMSSIQLVNRLITNVTAIPADKIKTGKLEDYEWEQFDIKIKELMGAPIYLDDTASLSVFELRTKARRLVREHNIKCVIIDYLQLMTASGMNVSSREQEVSIISRSLKGLAKELNIPIIALSQLNRNVESRQGADGKRPQLADLRESGAIEQDADLVCFIHRPEKYNILDDGFGNSYVGIAEIIVAKHRNGATGDVRLSFKKEYAKFMNIDDDIQIGEIASKINSPAQTSAPITIQPASESDFLTPMPPGDVPF